VLWSERQASLLRRMAAGERVNDQIDWENVAEEIEALGRSDRRELRSRVRTILTHLIKLRLLPATAPRSGGQETVIEQRAELRAVLNDSPSLEATLRDVIDNELPAARELATAIAAHHEQPRGDPAELSFTEDQVRGRWPPNGPLPRGGR
jgi:hypothetical protein